MGASFSKILFIPLHNLSHFSDLPIALMESKMSLLCMTQHKQKEKQ